MFWIFIVAIIVMCIMCACLGSEMPLENVRSNKMENLGYKDFPSEEDLDE